MIRPLSFVILLCASPILLAEPLYKWAEPDGTTTFSVQPPPAGIEYETVSGSKPANIDKQKAATPAQTQIAPAVQEAVSEASSQAQPSQQVAPQLGAKVNIRRGSQPSKAPQIDSDTSTDAGQPVVNDSSTLNTADQDNKQNMAAMDSKSRKQRQCEDLKKRVVSLEGRLRNRLTPEDMDNTVIHMARYQRSYNQHCAQ